MILYPYVHSAINGAVSYAISCTHTSGSDFAVEGTDRNGVVSGAYTTITIKEGDTITFNNVGSFSGIDLYILRGTHNILYQVDDDNRVLLMSKIKMHNTMENLLSGLPLRGQPENILCVIQTIILDLVRLNKPLSLSNQAQDNDVTYPVIGTTTGFYDKNLLTNNGEYPFGVMRNVIQSGKKKELRYTGFQFYVDDTSEVCMGWTTLVPIQLYRYY